MTGLIWFVQVVHYPLFAQVGAAESIVYAQRHQSRTTWVVAPPMFIELLAAAALVVHHPQRLTRWPDLTALALLAVIWCSTAWVQVPLHRRLLSGRDDAVIRRLVRTNWVRTAAWTLRAAILLSQLPQGVVT